MNRSTRVITFCCPTHTIPVSLTDTFCGLQCAHCAGHYLKHMRSPMRALKALESGEASSVLVSGGCDTNGRVPFMESLPMIERLKRKGQVNLHSGLIGESEARVLAGLADVVSLDLVGDQRTLLEVYGHGQPPEAYMEAYRALVEHVRVVPHLCIGLRGGALGHEDKVLRFLEAERAKSLVLLVFIPTKGTRYESREPPPVEAVLEVIAVARARLPEADISLGCMRPGGRYRALLDEMALRQGVDLIVNPSPQARRYARQEGFEIVYKRECCAL